MPRYRVTDPQTGRKLVLTGDSPPSEQELEQVFRNHNAQQDALARGETIGPAAGDSNSLSERAVDAMGMSGLPRQMMKTAMIPADFAAGAVKGIGSTAAGALKLLNRLSPNPDDRAKIAAQLADATPEPSGSVEQAGHMAEHAAEFAAPGAMGVRAPAAAGLAGRMGVAGAEMAGVRAVQRGDTEHLAGDAATGAAFPLGGTALRAAAKAGPAIERGAEMAARGSEYIPGGNIVLTPTMRKAIARMGDVLAKRRLGREQAAGDAVANESVAPAHLDDSFEQDFQPQPQRPPKVSASVLEEDFPVVDQPILQPGRPQVRIDEAGPDPTTGPVFPQSRPHQAAGSAAPRRVSVSQPPNQPRAQASVQQAQESTSKPSSPKEPAGVDDAQSTPQARSEEGPGDQAVGPEEDGELSQLIAATLRAKERGLPTKPINRPDMGTAVNSKLVRLQTMLAESTANNVGGYAGAEYRKELRKAIDAIRSGDTSLANMILSKPPKE